MEEKHSILYDHYSKYNAGNAALLRSVGSIGKNLVTKLPSITKSVLKDVVNDLPGRMRDEFRDRIATNLLQGKNPIVELNNDIQNRVYNDLIKEGIYNTNDLNRLFNKPASSYVAELSPLSITYNNLGDNILKQYPKPKSYSEYFNFPYTKSDDSESSENSDDSNKQQFYGGSSYKNKYYKYKNKCKN